MSIYTDKLAHIQVVINCRYFVAQMCTHEDALAHNLGALCIDQVMSYNTLIATAKCFLTNIKAFYAKSYNLYRKLGT